ncbi:MAG: YdbH domain-containing protein [Novosphingobium sp.]
MTQKADDIAAEIEQAVEVVRRRWPYVVGAVLLVFALSVGVAWLNRERIADNIVGSQLKKMDLPATYRIESIGPRRQVISNLVIGDPANPDLTVERAEVEIIPRFGWPAIGEVKAVRPRLYGTYRNGKLSFGTLDKVLFSGSGDKQFRMPDLDVALEDGRARIDGDLGVIGVKAEGNGNLRSGFRGELAAFAPSLAVQGCKADRATLYGALAITDERPSFTGPLRMAALACRASGLTMRDAAFQVKGTLDKALDGGDATIAPRVAALALAANRLGGIGGSIDLTYRKQALNARYDVTAASLSTPQVSSGALALKGALRSQDGLAKLESDGKLIAANLKLGADLDASLASAQKSAAKTLGEPLLAQLRGALARHAPGSRLNADFVLRQTGQITNLIVPQAVVTGGTGEVILGVSRAELVTGGAPAPRLAGNFQTGGAGMPRITGQMERRAGGMTLIRMAMAEYAAKDARLAFPQLALAQGPDGTLGFVGTARLSGAIPEGSVRQLDMPVDGRWAPGRQLELWRGCRNMRFAELTFSGLTLEREAIDLCPGSGGAIVRSTGQGIAIAARTGQLDLNGRLKTTPIRIAANAASFANPGTLSADRLVITIGRDATPTQFRIGTLKANVGREYDGTFANTEANIGAVPLDIVDGQGRWHFANGRLNLSGASFRLLDHEQVDRFEPLIARDAVLEMAAGRITAQAMMRDPRFDRAVAEAVIVHNLDTTRGEAELLVPGITFDRQLQPDMLTMLARGVVANVRGIVTGKGNIRWNGSTVSSTGTFHTEGMDLAAAFGPSKGISGTVEFIDLLGLVTAEHQKLRIASINPGIEVEDGLLDFELKPGHILDINGVEWPFMDGTLSLLPTRMNLGVPEVRRYELKVVGLNSARFIEKMEIGNISASGTFDGTLPLVFDENGGKIVGGLLISRPPGGNVSYVGELTYKDLSAMGNFAFEALRSLNYRRMTIAMDGDLDGEMVTRVRFEGVKQGEGASRNFITRQLGRLPLQFNVNIRAPFQKLIANFKSLYDPTFLPDPQRAGLIDAQGRPLPQPRPQMPSIPVPVVPAVPSSPPSPAQPGVQPPESENKP